MKLTDNYMKREIAGEVILIPMGKMSAQFNGMITLNETAQYIFCCLEEGKDEDDIVKGMLEEYEVDETTAKAEVINFLTKCKEWKVIE